MTKFIITEQQNATSYRKGTEVEAKSLTAAKVMAAKAQMFQRTYLLVTSIDGDILATRDETGKWSNA